MVKLCELQEAIRQKHSQVIRFVKLLFGTEFIASKSDTELLNHAIFYGHEELVRFLLDAGCEINSCDKNDMLPISVASGRGQYAIMRLLIERGADISEHNVSIPSPLATAINSNNEESLKILLEYGNGRSSSLTVQEKTCALFYACSVMNPELVQLIVTNGVLINARNKENNTTPLLFVSEVPMSQSALLATEFLEKRKKIMELLLSHGADINASNAGKTALSNAVERNEVEMVKLLLSKGANTDIIKEEDGYAPLHLATIAGSTDLIALLLGAGASIDYFTKSVVITTLPKPASIPLRNGKVEVDFPFTRMRIHSTPLALALKRRNIPIARFLIERGANVNLPLDSSTPLIFAVESGDLELVKLLLSKGARIDATHREFGFTAIQAAQKMIEHNENESYKHIRDMLLSHKKGANNG